MEENKNIFRRITEEKKTLKVQVEKVEKLLPSETLRVIEQISLPTMCFKLFKSFSSLSSNIFFTQLSIPCSNVFIFWQMAP